jgi:hypothetical protein
MVLSTSVVNGVIYAIGGSDLGISNNWLGTSIVAAYDPTTDTWATQTDMPTARARLSIVALDGKIYAIGGGKAYPNEAFATVEEYTPEGWQPTTVSAQGNLTTTWGEIKL